MASGSGIHWALVDSVCQGLEKAQVRSLEPAAMKSSLSQDLSTKSELDRKDVFTIFASLPKELRLQIWTQALEPRVIPLHRIEDRFKAGRPVYYPRTRTSINYMALSTNHPSLDKIRRVCPEAQLLCQRSYVDWEVWDVRRNQMGTPYNPDRDVIYFSYHISASVLMDFVKEFPMETSSMRTIALPGVLFPETASRVEVLAALHAFEKLSEVIIVLGKATEKVTSNALWQGGSGKKDAWVLPHGAQAALQRLKDERWPHWKLPIVTIAKSQEDIPIY